MGSKHNHLSRKRALNNANSSKSLQLTKKRVPLGELTNSISVAPSSKLTKDSCNSVGSTQKKLGKLKQKSEQDLENRLATESTRNSDGDGCLTQTQIKLGDLKEKDELEVENFPSESSGESNELIGDSIGELLKEKSEVESSVSGFSTQDLELKKCSFSSSLYGYLRYLEKEDKRRCLLNYITEVQTDVSEKMREILVDWLVEVAEEFKLVSDTIYLTVSYIDRYLSSKALNRNQLQLLGVSCMLIASKYEEISPPHVEDFCFITDNTYVKEQVVNIEKDVLKLLNYEMSTPTAKNFLRILSKAVEECCECPDSQSEFLMSYLAELSLLSYQCVCFLPSIVAASAIFLSRFTFQPKKHPWNALLQQCSGYSPSDLKECVLAIHDLQLKRKASAAKALRDKYSKHKFKSVAELSSPLRIPDHYFQATHE